MAFLRDVVRNNVAPKGPSYKPQFSIAPGSSG